MAKLTMSQKNSRRNARYYIEFNGKCVIMTYEGQGTLGNHDEEIARSLKDAYAIIGKAGKNFVGCRKAHGNC